jgi:predicted transposase/invertase (TIGR01784 family)
MSDDSIHNPHDKLAKATFSDIPTAVAFLQEHLEPGLSSSIDWATPRVESGTFIAEEFAASESDLLYTATINQSKAFLYILFEHQSTDDRWIALRLLAYMVRIWEKALRADSSLKKLPPIVPIVLAQSDKLWQAPVRFSDLIEVPSNLANDLAAHTPDFSYRLVELYRIPFDKILGTPMGILTLRALKAERIGALLDDTVWDEPLLTQLPPFAIEMLLRYILRADIDKVQFLRKIKNITNQSIQSSAMTLEQQFRQEGRQEGRREEQIHSKQQSVIEVLETRFEQVPEGLIEAIENINDLPRLTQLLASAARCTDLEAFAASL